MPLDLMVAASVARTLRFNTNPVPTSSPGHARGHEVTDLVWYPTVRADHAGYVPYDAELVEMTLYYKVRNHLVCIGDIYMLSPVWNQ